jgi:hypothetical protein
MLVRTSACIPPPASGCCLPSSCSARARLSHLRQETCGHSLQPELPYDAFGQPVKQQGGDPYPLLRSQAQPFRLRQAMDNSEPYSTVANKKWPNGRPTHLLMAGTAVSPAACIQQPLNPPVQCIAVRMSKRKDGEAVSPAASVEQPRRTTPSVQRNTMQRFK